jgi:hypothetical protein
MKELQDFADAFTQLVEVLTADYEYEPFAAIIPPEDDPLVSIRHRLLALENRLGEVHRLVDQHETRIDTHLSRISELEVRAMVSNGRKEH